MYIPVTTGLCNVLHDVIAVACCQRGVWEIQKKLYLLGKSELSSVRSLIPGWRQTE
jgi:hypothetical protein